MTHIDDRTMDMVVLDPDVLAVSQRTAIENHLAVCDGCRALLETIREVYRSLERPLEAPPAEMDYLVRQIVPAPKVIRLIPRAVPRESVPATASSPRPSDQKPDRFITITTYEAESGIGSLVLKRNPTSKQFRTEFQASRFLLPRWGIVSLVESVPVLLDESGRSEFTLEGQSRPPEWIPGEAFVRFPAGTVHCVLPGVLASRSRSVADPAGVFSAKFSDANAELRIDFQPRKSGGVFQYATVIDEAGEAQILQPAIHAQTSNPDEIVVIGSAMLDLPADRILVRITLEYSDKVDGKSAFEQH